MTFYEGLSPYVIARSPPYVIARSGATTRSTCRTLNRRDCFGLGFLDCHGLTPSQRRKSGKYIIARSLPLTSSRGAKRRRDPPARTFGRRDCFGLGFLDCHGLTPSQRRKMHKRHREEHFSLYVIARSAFFPYVIARSEATTRSICRALGRRNCRSQGTPGLPQAKALAKTL